MTSGASSPGKVWEWQGEPDGDVHGGGWDLGKPVGWDSDEVKVLAGEVATEAGRSQVPRMLQAS